MWLVARLINNLPLPMEALQLKCQNKDFCEHEDIRQMTQIQYLYFFETNHHGA